MHIALVIQQKILDRIKDIFNGLGGFVVFAGTDILDNTLKSGYEIEPIQDDEDVGQLF